MLKRYKTGLLVSLALLGAAYFAAYANLDEQFLLNSAIILPVQVAACGLLLYGYWTGRLKGTSRADSQRSPRSKS